MKRMKKMLAMLLAVVMVMAMSATAFAAEKPADLSKHTFTAYQIFNADSIDANKELSNITWGEGITAEGQAALLETYGVSTVPALAKKISNGDIDAKAFALEVAKYKKDGTGRAVVSGTTTLPIGYYLIEDTTPSDLVDGKEDQVYNLSILKVSDNETPVVVTNKTSVPEVKKEILDPTPVETNEAGIGEDVTYRFTGSVPSNFADFKTYYYSFTDTLSKGLTYNEDLTVEIKNGENDLVDVTDYFYVNAAASGDNTIITVAVGDLKALNLVEGITVNAMSEVVVTYTAKVNEDAIIAGDGNPNKVYLEYSNKPNDSGEPSTTPPDGKEPEKKTPTGKTPEDDVITYVTELTIIKVDENGNTLQGAEFTLTGTNIHSIKITTGTAFVVDENGTYYKLKNGTYTTEAPQAEVRDEDGDVTIESNEDLYEAPVDGRYVMYKESTFVETTGEPAADKSVSAFVGADGKVTFTGLGAGDYTIEETVVPEGYNKAEDIEFTITYADGVFTSSNPDVVLNSEKPNTFKTTIINKSGAVLPETGGMGTRIFYVLGTVLVLGAGVLLITKKRMSAR